MNTNGLQVDVTRLYDIADEFVDRYRKRLESIDAKGTGNLIKSLRADIEVQQNTVTFFLNALEYWYFIENGRGPSRSSGWNDPIQDLTTWIISKIQRGKFMPQPGKALPTTEKEIRHVAWGVYTNITKKGFERTGDKAEPLQRTLDESQDLLIEFAQVVADQLGKEVVAEFMTLNNPEKGAPLTQRISPNTAR